MNLSKTLITIILASLVGVATCLSAVIRGVVTDNEGSELPGALVRLMSPKDSIGHQSVMTDVDGSYEFNNVAPNIYALRVSMTGMDPSTTDVEVKSENDTINIRPIVLTENSVLLDEAVVTAVKAAVVAKEDTLEFNAGSFHTTPNASVEDLLKKLPGVEVGSDGSITSGGKTISKILVDGKEFFADDPKMASKNLPSSMVDKVQVVDRKSETARLTGVDDGDDETVINLTVKKDMNNGFFGTIGGGYGTDHRFRADANLNWFKDGNQVSIIAGGNNVNESGFTDMGRGRFRDFGGNNGINTTSQFGINFNVGNEEKFRVGGNVMYSYTDRDSWNRFDTQYLFPDSVSWLRGGGTTRDRGHSLRANFRMQWNITEADVLDFRPDFQLNYRKSEQRDSSILYATVLSDSRVNSNIAMRANRGLDIQTGGRLVYTHKFLSRPGRSFSAQVRYTFANTKEHSTTWNDIEYYLRQEDSERIFQYLDSRQWSNFVEGRLTWTEPLGNNSGGNYLEIAYLASVRFNNADKLTYNVPREEGEPAFSWVPEYSSVPDGAVLDNDLSNRFRNKFTNQQLQLGYKKTTKVMNLNVGLMFSPSSTRSEDLINPERNIATRWVWNISPYLRFRYRFSKNSSLMMNYRARTSQPSLTQLQPVADVSDPLNIKVGNPDLKPTFTQNFGIHFNNYNATTQQSIFAVANASFALNNVVSRTVADPETGVRTTMYTNANGNWNVFAMMMLNQPFRNPKWRISARFNGRYTSNAGYIDGDFNRSGNLVLSPTVGMTFSSNIFQMTATPTYSFQMATSSLARQPDQFTHSYGFDTDASLYLPFGLELTTDLSFAKSSGYSIGFDNTQWLWNAGLSYSLLRDKSLTLSVKAYDLLGEKKNISRTVSANRITDRQYNDLSRYVMFGITYKFNTLSKKTTVNIDGDFPGPPPGERPGGRDGGHPGGRGPMMPPPGR
ncbi:MAG: outer membrane beta-barrel protein [Muribaculaceae bacterium]|nr:outer membrane beta-barrel protein [Muribaculaceae bacterium]